jgi:pimeloyl-ACP methyl ester carboxylesterase
MLGLQIKRMKPLQASATRLLLLAVFSCCTVRAAELPAPAAWKETHDALVVRLRNVALKENAFGPAYQPLYHAAIPWYELWGGRDQNPVDEDMVSPEVYAGELADALENGRNYFAENPGTLYPLVFSKTLPGGREVSANYWLRLPAGFPATGRKFPLVIDLHGSGWLGHKISYKSRGGFSGPTFAVTPINMGGPWQIDFLNAYLDELLAILPIDQDRVYLQGHSLGAMATWEWALNNPERFAAISPRAGIGEPYRAQRLKYVPAWVIHGENDNVIPSGYADQMVTALQSQGAGVRLSIIKAGEHNMPGDLDQGQVLDWFLKQTRSHLPVPADPRDELRLDASGFSPSEVMTVPATPSWKSQPLDLSSGNAFRAASAVLFQKAHARGDLVDSPIRREMEANSNLTTLWLAVPKSLHNSGQTDPSTVDFPRTQVERFYFRGETQRALAHLKEIDGGADAGGHALSGRIWVTSMSIWWQEGPLAIAECWAEIKE